MTDRNVSNYTTDELLAIIDTDELDSDEVIERTTQLIEKFQTTDPELAIFFQDVQDKLLAELENSHHLINRRDVERNDVFQVPVQKDKMNPNLKNTIQRFVNLDSQFRQHSTGSSTEYTLDLSDTLKDVLSIRLYSYQIPNTWYVVDANNYFFIADDNQSVIVTVPKGNYSPTEFVIVLNQVFTNLGFTFATPPVSYNKHDGKLKLSVFGGQFPDTTVITTNTRLVFYDGAGRVNLNTTLGWLMGYRDAIVNVVAVGNEAPAVLNLSGTKYLILVIDDYNQNHVNNGLVSITQLSTTLKTPSYYTTDMPFVLEQNDKVTPIILPTIPRTLTQPQIYTINEINRNKNTQTNQMAKAPTSANILAVIPIKNSGEDVGKLLVDFSGGLQDSSRTYFGPVNIDRLCVRLLDDRGMQLNLNGADWCVTMICECLYQY